MFMAKLSCRRLLAQVAWQAFARALASAGSSIAARIPIMATTTSNSMSVKPIAHTACALSLPCLDGRATLHHPVGQAASGSPQHRQRAARHAELPDHIQPPVTVALPGHRGPVGVDQLPCPRRIFVQ